MREIELSSSVILGLLTPNGKEGEGKYDDIFFVLNYVFIINKTYLLTYILMGYHQNKIKNSQYNSTWY